RLQGPAPARRHRVPAVHAAGQARPPLGGRPRRRPVDLTRGAPPMAMSETLIAEVKHRAQRERERHEYPEDFPLLPPVPAARYSDPEFAALEQEAVFGRSWLFVAHADQVRQPGDYVLVEHLALPLIVVRGQDGVVRAHVNTCKHRGAALLTEPSGSTGRRMTC